MISRNSLLGIANLRLFSYLGGMSDNDYNVYCEFLEEFIDKFPTQETSLKNYCKSSDFVNFTEVLTELKRILTKIYADDLAKKCDELLVSIKDPNRDMAEANLSYFLTIVSMLSIEIQMAKHKKDVPEDAKNTIETKVERMQKSILAVDDVPLFLSTLHMVLKNTDYKFTGVTSGAAALKYLQAHKVDLLLLDIEMPGMNGYDLAQLIKISGQTAPIIFLTGNAKKEYVVKAMQVGAADFIVKPINSDQVLEKIKKYI